MNDSELQRELLKRANFKDSMDVIGSIFPPELVIPVPNGHGCWNVATTAEQVEQRAKELYEKYGYIAPGFDPERDFGIKTESHESEKPVEEKPVEEKPHDDWKKRIEGCTSIEDIKSLMIAMLEEKGHCFSAKRHRRRKRRRGRGKKMDENRTQNA